MKIVLALLIFISTVLLAVMFYRQQRIKRLSALINFVAEENKEKKIQQLKNNHEAEMILEKKNILLGIARRFDSNMSWKAGLTAVCITVICLANLLLSLELDDSSLVLSAVIVMVIAIVLPGKIRGMIVNRRVKKMSSEIPWLVDLLAVCVQCGMSPEASFRFLSEKMAGINPDFTPFLERLVKRTEVSGMSDALKRFYLELPSQENRMLCATLEQSLQYGSSLYEQLITLSRDIREVQLLAVEEKIGKLGAKMSVPLILFFMFPVVVVVAVPGVMRVLSNG
ncbi:type II secretion system F family protein [Erwinia oleae]|uniref:type II secretion system F family protein n=1 Tax=Erwinia oleae TaxID=796334 RepID=UPI00068F3257|nr:type II secretion system F family protein [Erwinia oleae]